jgi:hypothetical protein
VQNWKKCNQFAKKRIVVSPSQQQMGTWGTNVLPFFPKIKINLAWPIDTPDLGHVN